MNLRVRSVTGCSRSAMFAICRWILASKAVVKLTVHTDLVMPQVDNSSTRS